MQQTIVPPTCPLTGMTGCRILENVDLTALEHKWVAQTGISVAEGFVGVIGMALYESPVGLRFFSPPVTGSGEFYRRLGQTMPYYDDGRWEHLRALDDLRQTSLLLEIGCGDGAFLRRATSAGIKAVGVELNTAAAQKAQREGLTVYTEEFGTFAQAHQSVFGSVCAFQVLEHLENPRQFFEHAAMALKPGGRLILGVPDCTSYLRHLDTVLDLPPHHVTRWSSQVFQRVGEHFPFSLNKVRREPLAHNHVDVFIASQCNVLRKACPVLARWLFPSLVQRAARKALRLGLRRTLNGQCLYADFSRL